MIGKNAAEKPLRTKKKGGNRVLTPEELFRLKLQGRANKWNGDWAEELAAEALRRLGFQCVEPIQTGFQVVRSGGRITGAFPMTKVSGDIKAIAPGGRSVHCEVKYQPDPYQNLRWSMFTRKRKSHQIKALNDTVAAGGIGLVVWVRGYTEACVLQWPIAGFCPGKGLSWEQACSATVEIGKGENR